MRTARNKIKEKVCQFVSLLTVTRKERVVRGQTWYTCRVLSANKVGLEVHLNRKLLTQIVLTGSPADQTSWLPISITHKICKLSNKVNIKLEKTSFHPTNSVAMNSAGLILFQTTALYVRCINREHFFLLRKLQIVKKYIPVCFKVFLINKCQPTLLWTEIHFHLMNTDGKFRYFDLRDCLFA